MDDPPIIRYVSPVNKCSLQKWCEGQQLPFYFSFFCVECETFEVFGKVLKPWKGEGGTAEVGGLEAFSVSGFGDIL